MSHINTYLTITSSDPTNISGSAADFTNSLPRMMEFDPLKDWEVAVTDVTYYQAATPLGSIQSIYIYSDIVQPSIIGSQNAQLLRRVLSATPGTREDIALHEPLHFRPLATRNFSTVSIELRDSLGNLMSTSAGEPTTIVLAFRVRHPD